ncbi:hypothetical protein ACE6H2_020854 [Prunus campanulata]
MGFKQVALAHWTCIMFLIPLRRWVLAQRLSQAEKPAHQLGSKKGPLQFASLPSCFNWTSQP